MALLSQDDQQNLLIHLTNMGSKGRAEGEDQDRFQLTYYPVPEHLRAFDPDVVLIVGPRGAGKTELFRVGIEFGLLAVLAGHIPNLRLPPLDKTSYVVAYPLARDFPDDLGLKQFAERANNNNDLYVELWFAYLVRALRSKLNTDGLNPLFAPAGGDVDSVLRGFRQCGPLVLGALDNLDEQLEKEDRHLFVGYDELDTLGRRDWHTVNALVQGLVGFWASRTRRWRRLRAKIFLRTDLYERAGVSAGADFAKLAANRADITWSDANLFGMLVKRIANTDKSLLDYCKSSKIEFKATAKIGQIPQIQKPGDARPFVERLVGPYMGANANKGLTFRWILDHIRDGRGHAIPRALVRLVERAAEMQKSSGKFARAPRLLDPRSLRQALSRVSEEHVNQSQDEWPWLDGLKDRLKDDHEVPWKRRSLERVLAEKWNEPWSSAEVTPPARDAREMVDYLVEVGIIRIRSDDRIDVPDLFLDGLNLKRKGGVTRQ